MSATSSLPGFRDFFPAELGERAWLFGVWRDVARRFAFEEYDGPPLEPLDLYTRKSGDEIVGQLYAFEDKGGRSVALRPEMTPTVARMVASRANALRKPVRWFSIPQLFRYERQQKGRLREHFQLNVDLFGEADVTADAELLAVACEIMRGCGLGPEDVRARVSDRRLLVATLEALGVAPVSMPAAFAAIDKIDRDPWPVLVERMVLGGIPESVAAECLAVARTSSLTLLRERLGGVPAVAEALTRFERYEALLRAHGVLEYVTFDLSIVRGLAYYTGIVFELFDARGEFRAICGGGRYDNLLKDLAGVEMPALGFGMGDVVLGDLIRSRSLMPPRKPVVDAWVAGADGVAVERVIEVVRLLRQAGLSVDYALRGQQLGKQLKAAGTLGAVRAVIVPADSDDSVDVKALDSGAQERRPLAELPSYLAHGRR